MNIKTLKVVKKWANLMFPANSVWQNICITEFEKLPEKEKKQTLNEFKLQIMLHNN